MTDRAAFDAAYDSTPEELGGRALGWLIWQAAIKHEREACAKVCEDRSHVCVNRSLSIGCDREMEMGAALEANACAAAIRARG